MTDQRMMRFFFSLNEAVDLIIYALQHAKGGETFIQKMSGLSLYEMATDFSKKYGCSIKITGIRPGEKLYETLIADYEGKEYTSDKADKSKEIIKIYA